ncbi:MAG: glycosyltransferase [Acidobacteriota bacterium]
MKILRIIARLNVGGPARHVVWLTRELQDAEFQTALIAGSVPDGEEDMGYFAEQNRVAPIYLKDMSRELSAKDITSIFKIYSIIRREKPDIIHTHTAKAGTVGRLAGWMYRWLTWRTLIGRPHHVRMVHTFHGHVFHSYYGNAKTRLFLIVEKVLARLATDKIIAISDQQLREINQDFGVGREKQFKVVPLGIDLEAFYSDAADRKSIRDEINASDDEIVVGFVGRLTEIKNIGHLLDVAAMYNNELSEYSKAPIKFVIVGDGHLRVELEAKARKLGITDNLTFLGNRNDTARVYQGLDIVALTSLNEGTPLSLIEAMASGRPVISTLVGGVVDLLGPVREDAGGYQIRERGIGIESRSVGDYLKGLDHLAENRKLRDDLAEAGRRFVREKYSKERLVDDIKQLYRELA